MHIPRAARVLAVGLLPAWLVVVAVSAQSTGGNAEAKKIKNPVASTPASLSAGAATYKKYCAFCHNDDGTGEGALAPKDSHPPDLTDAEWTHGSSDGEIFTIIQEGAGPKSVMKAFNKKITEQDAWNVVNYLHSLRRTGSK